MSYGTVVMNIPIFFLFSSMFLGTNGELSYSVLITEKVISCANYKNEFLNCDGLSLGSANGDDAEDGAKLSGVIETFKDINSDFDVEIDIYKVTELGDEIMYTIRVNFCSSLNNTDAPWAPVVEKMNISGCPVPVSTFEVQGLTVSLDSMNDIMCHDFIGEYRIYLSFIDVATKISCHIVEISIVENDSNNEYGCFL